MTEATVTCKAGVVFAGFTPALLRILVGLMRLSEAWVVMITAGSDGTHLDTSRHYTFEAVDVRTKHYSGNRKLAFVEAVKRELGPAFTVLLEDEGGPQEHLHIQPVRGTDYRLAAFETDMARVSGVRA